MPLACVVGDSVKHGSDVVGSIIGGVVVGTSINGIKIAVVGDETTCNVHDGPQQIVTGSLKVGANHWQVARAGDTTSCGAVLVADNNLKVQIA